jgi:hypothetical protein
MSSFGGLGPFETKGTPNLVVNDSFCSNASLSCKRLWAALLMALHILAEYRLSTADWVSP